MTSSSFAANCSRTGSTSWHVGQSFFTTAVIIGSVRADPVEDQVVDLVGLLDVEEMAGAVDDLDVRPVREMRPRGASQLDAEAAVGVAVEVQRRLWPTAGDAAARED